MKFATKYHRFGEKMTTHLENAKFDENVEIRERCKGVHCVDLGESFPTSIYLQNLASIQPRTISGSVSNVTVVIDLFVPLRYLKFLRIIRFTSQPASRERAL